MGRQGLYRSEPGAHCFPAPASAEPALGLRQVLDRSWPGAMPEARSLTRVPCYTLCACQLTGLTLLFLGSPGPVGTELCSESPSGRGTPPPALVVCNKLVTGLLRTPAHHPVPFLWQAQAQFSPEILPWLAPPLLQILRQCGDMAKMG